MKSMTGHRIQASAGGAPLPRHVLHSGIIATATIRRLTYVCVCSIWSHMGRQEPDVTCVPFPFPPPSFPFASSFCFLTFSFFFLFFFFPLFPVFLFPPLSKNVRCPMTCFTETRETLALVADFHQLPKKLCRLQFYYTKALCQDTHKSLIFVC